MSHSQRSGHSYECPVCFDECWVFADLMGKKSDACPRCTRKSELDWKTVQKVMPRKAE